MECLITFIVIGYIIGIACLAYGYSPDREPEQ